MIGIFPKLIATRIGIAVTIVILTIPLPTCAENGFVMVQVKDVLGHPVNSLEIGVDGYGGTARTGSDGKARIPLGSAATPGDPITLSVLHSPKERDLVMVSPWNGKAQIPHFEDKPENYLTVVVMNRGDRSSLERSDFLRAATAKINYRNSRPAANKQSDPPDPQSALAMVAKEYGYSPDDLDQAIRAWRPKTNDPYDIGLTLLYKRDFARASREFGNSLALREAELRAAQTELAEKQEKVANAALFLGSSLYAQGKYEESAEAFRKYLDVRPDDPFILDRTATSLQAAGNY